MRNHRWRPKSKGWIRTFDRGSLVIWMKPEIDGVSIALYNGEYPFTYEEDRTENFNENLAETWLIRVPKNSDIPYMIMDKPHRIRMASYSSEYPEYEVFSKEVKQIPHCHYGHPRLNRKRKVFRWPLPPKIERALY